MMIESRKNGAVVLRGWLKIVILFALGGYFGYLMVSGNWANYVNARFAWLSNMAAIVLVLLAGFATSTVIMRKQRNSAVVVMLGTTKTLTWRVLAIALLPLLFGLFVPSTPLGADAVNGGISTRAVLTTIDSGFSIAPESRNVLDWLREFSRGEDYERFNGQPADIIGFVYREPHYPENHFMVARFTLSCCVADASALGVPVFIEDAESYTEGVWVRVRGTMQVGEFVTDLLPIVQAQSIEIIEQPEQPYLYP